MYSSSGGVANGGRIYNPRPDPAEIGPPRRVNREESHIGEMVASSKRRIAWTFTLGESDTVHEVVLVHSIMSYKKVVEFDGRQMHFSATATPGDWSYTMFLDGTKYAIEVRINDLESADVPKYDLVIDRVPFRRWDVYRRRKQASGQGNGYGYGQSNGYGQQQQQQPPAGQAGGSFGTHRWGPSGMTAPAPMEPSPSAQAQRNSGSFYRRDSGSSNYQSPPLPAQYNGGAPQRQQPAQQTPQRQQPGQPTPQPAAVPARKPQQREFDLLGDFGGSEVATVTAQQLIFDPLASSKLGGAPAPQQQAMRTVSNPAMAPTAYGVPMLAHANARTGSNPQMGYGGSASPVAPPAPQAYVDPFASVSQPLPMKPVAPSISLDPLASQNSMYLQQNRSPSMTYPSYQPQQAAMPRGMPLGSMPMQQQPPPQGGYPVSGGMPGQNAAYAPKAGGGVNYNISHLMNPMEVNNLRNAQQTKTINIDPFAGLNK